MRRTLLVAWAAGLVTASLAVTITPTRAEACVFDRCISQCSGPPVLCIIKCRKKCATHKGGPGASGRGFRR